jgi:hypothetical protein
MLETSFNPIRDLQCGCVGLNTHGTLETTHSTSHNMLIVSLDYTLTITALLAAGQVRSFEKAASPYSQPAVL